MNLPAKDILIDNIVFSVETQDPDTMGLDGKMVGRTNRLLLRSDQTPADLLDTFAHEVIHAIVRARCPGAMTESVEEAVVQAIAPGLIQVLRENPDWLVWAVRLAHSSGKRQLLPIGEAASGQNTPSIPKPEKENSNARTDKPPHDTPGRTGDPDPHAGLHLVHP